MKTIEHSVHYLSQRKQLQKKQLIVSSALLVMAFATVFFSRFLDLFGAPSTINFLHFVTIPLASGIVLTKTKITNISQIRICHAFLAGLGMLLLIELASAVLNSAGLINVILDTLLLVEPFLLLLAIVSLPICVECLTRLRQWFEGFVFFHLFLIYVQKFALNYCHMEGDCDNVQGIFYRSGSGHVVGASISASFGIYYFTIAQSRPLWLRIFVLIVGLGNIQTSDAKQVVVTLIVGVVLLILGKKDITRSLMYIAGLGVFLAIFIWAIQNIEALASFNTWIRPEIYGPNGEATKLKLSGIRIIIEHFESPFHWLLGLGPGHTIDRLGGWMLRDYASLLSPLGSTRTTIGQEVWRYVASSWLAEGSSMFAPFWGWAAIWGDLGWLGLITYGFLSFIVWQRLCLDDVSRLLLLTILVHGFIFTQLEEPAYMLSMAMMVGIRWHSQQLKKIDATNVKTVHGSDLKLANS